MRLREKFDPFAVLKAAAGGLVTALVLIIVLGDTAISSPSMAAEELAASSGAAPRAPDLPTECFEDHHPCGPVAITAAHAEPLFLGPTRRASFLTPRATALARDGAPHVTTSLTILFRNFRK